MDVREVSDVEEVVGHPRRRCRPDLDAGVDSAIGRIGLGGDRRDRGDGRARAHPDQAVAFLDVDRQEMCGGRHGASRSRRGHLDTPATVPEGPPVIRTDQAPGIEATVAERRFSMRASIGSSDELTGRGTPDHQFLTQQRHGDRRTGHVVSFGNRVPVMLQRLVFGQHVGRLLRAPRFRSGSRS